MNNLAANQNGAGQFAGIKRALIYARVSGNEGTIDGSESDEAARVAGQIDECQKWCAAHGLEVGKVYSEVESGAGDGSHREQQQLLLKEVQAGDLIVCVKLDRWARELGFDIASIKQIREIGANWYSIGEPFLYEASPQVKLVRNQLAGFAEYEREVIKERTVGKRKRLRSLGYCVEGIVAIGYRRVDRILVPHVEEAELVKKVFALCIGGKSVAEIVEWLSVEYSHLQAEHFSKQKPRYWDKKLVGTMLRNRVYLGELRKKPGKIRQTACDPNDWFRGLHEPIIDVLTFEAAAAALDGRKIKIGGTGRTAVPGKGSAHTENWLLRGIANCLECSRRMGPAYRQRRRNKAEYDYYYKCNGRNDGCSTGYMRVEKVDSEVERQVLERLEALSSGILFDQPTCWLMA